MATDAQRAALGVPVSGKLQSLRTRLLSTGADLERIIRPEIGSYCSDLLSGLESHIAKIAFIGQVKAGKTSLVNALLGSPNFLPTDVNPSTAAVTKVYFGAHERQNGAAVFHLFSEQEWEALVTGNAGERKAFLNLPSTRSQLTALHERAEKSLGPDFQKKLGKSHLFTSVTSEQIGQYVSVSSYRKAGAREASYSDITKFAEIFLEPDVSNYPTMFIDTPGINDLFFIRDEITHANLADADIYVLTLSALQPLSGADLLLLRLLRGLQKEKIIVVVNRIDSIPAETADFAAIEARVRNILEREFPNATIPIVLASAMWANTAHLLQQGSATLAVPANLADYAEWLGFDAVVDLSGIRSRRFLARDDSEVLLRCSGLRRIFDFIGNFITSSVTEEQMLTCASTLSALAHNTAMSARLALKALPLETTLGKGRISADELKRMSYSHLGKLESLVRETNQFLNQMLDEWQEWAALEIENLKRFMYRGLDFFLEEQLQYYWSREVHGSDFAASFSAAAVNFRSELADDFGRQLADLNRILIHKQREVEIGLRKILKAQLPAIDSTLQFGIAAGSRKPSSILSLGKATAMESPEFWEIQKERQSESGYKRDELRATLAIEFSVVAEDLLNAAATDLRLNASASVSRLRNLAFSAIYPLIEELEELVRIWQDEKAMANGASPRTISLDEFDAEMQKKIDQYEALSSTLNKIKKDCFQVAAS